MTLIVFVGILTYFCVLLSDIINKKNFSITTTLAKGRLEEGQSKVYLTKDNFDIGIYVYYNGDSKIQENIDEYFQFRIQSVTLGWGSYSDNPEEYGNIYQWDMNNITLVPCDSTRFGGNQKQKELGISSKYFCPEKNFNISMYGSFSSSKAGLIQVLVNYCEQFYLDDKFPGQNRTCRPQAESDAIIGKMQIYLPIMISYFDQKEFDEYPIKTYINGDLYNTLQTNLSNNKIYKITRHNVILQDSWISSIYKKQLETYYDYEYAHSYISPVDTSQYNPLLTFQFMLNENYYLEERKVQNIFNVFSLIGGMISVVVITTRLLLFWIQRSLFQLSILKAIFFTDNDVESYERSASQKPQMTSSSKGILPVNTTLGIGTFKTDPEKQELPQISFLKKTQSQKQLNPFNYIRNLKNFSYTFCDIIRYQFRKHGCIYKKFRLRDKLYTKGIQKLDERFDVINLFKSIAKIELLSQIILSRYQINLLPYLKSNVLHIDQEDIFENDKLSEKTDESKDRDEFLQIYIKQLILQSQNGSKVDKRILKNLLPQDADRKSLLKKSSSTDIQQKIQKSILMKYAVQLPSPLIKNKENDDNSRDPK